MLDIPLKKWVTGRPPILEATRVLGLNDQRVAKLMEFTQPAIAQWANGSVKIHPKRQLALLGLVQDLIAVTAEPPDDPKMARRVAAVRQAAQAWYDVALEEFKEAIGRDNAPSNDLLLDAIVLRDRMWAQLVARGMIDKLLAEEGQEP